jgi:hypothetical protein
MAARTRYMICGSHPPGGVSYRLPDRLKPLCLFDKIARVPYIRQRLFFRPHLFPPPRFDSHLSQRAAARAVSNAALIRRQPPKGAG